MTSYKLIEDLSNQIKESQIKLGYVKERVRLYYTLPSLCRILSIEAATALTLCQELEASGIWEATPLGPITFAEHLGRIEVNVSPQGVEYVHNFVSASPFLEDIIHLFGSDPHCSLSRVHELFARYDAAYLWEQMPEGFDFDYVFHFSDSEIDSSYYCFKDEMGHLTYHRYGREDYLALF